MAPLTHCESTRVHACPCARIGFSLSYMTAISFTSNPAADIKKIIEGVLTTVSTSEVLMKQEHGTLEQIY
jgi:hypothetical protein